MRLLAFDCATSGCSVAVCDGDRLLAGDAAAMARGQAEALVPMIDRVMRAAGCGFDALDRIAVTVGPGAFTGLRIGLATARGLGLSTGLPVSGVTTFEAIALGVAGAVPAERPLLVAVDARRADVYLQLFGPSGAAGSRTPQGPAGAVLPGDIPVWLAARDIAADTALALAGDGVEQIADALAGRPGAVAVAPGPGRPEAPRVAAIAAARAGGPEDLPARPFYLRPPDAALPAAALPAAAPPATARRRQ